jgi:subtilisin family serine protease
VATVKSSNPAFIAAAGRQSALVGAARNRPVGKLPSGAAPKDDVERLTAAERAAAKRSASGAGHAPGQEPLADKQWDMRMIDATPSGSYRVNQGRRGVMVGIMDTGVDGSHPDIRPNFNRRLSRNFTTDIPLIDGPCEDEPDQSCNDPADVDKDGHGTHVAGLVAAALNGLGTAGVAPRVTLVNIRAGQDSGFFFLQPTVDAMVYAGLVGIDVINMSFFTDPWLYNCLDNPADSPEEQLEQLTPIRVATQRAISFARGHGVTPVAALGNEHTDLGNPTVDTTSPDFPPGTERTRTVDNSCLTVPTETRGVISISALGPSGYKADYSNYGIEQTDFSAPGGWFRDYFGLPQNRQPENLNLSPMPRALAEEALQEPANVPFILRDCKGSTCAFYQYLQGTSMAAPHATGVAALIVSAHGKYDGKNGGLTLSPRAVERILTRTAKQTPCPSPPNFAYPDDRDPSFDGVCEGTLARNGIYGRGIVNALTAVLH